MANDWELDRLGVVVSDIEKAIAHYRKIGLEVAVSIQERKLSAAVDGPTGSGKSDIYQSCIMQNQAVRIELVQPVSSGSIFSRFLANSGEGVCYMEFRVNDLEIEKQRLADYGISIIAVSKRNDGSDGEIFFDTRRFGNVIIALYSEPVSVPVFMPTEGEWKFHHVGMIVKNVDEVAAVYQRMGFEPIAPIKEPVFAQNTQDWEIFGKHPQNPYKIRWTQMQNGPGTFIIEITQAVEGESLMMDYARKHGQGLNHFHIKVKDLAKEKANMEKQGFPTVMSVKTPACKMFETFYDTTQIGGFYFALWCGPGPFNARQLG